MKGYISVMYAFAGLRNVFMMLSPLCVALLAYVEYFLAMMIGGVPLGHDLDHISARRYLGHALNYGVWLQYMLAVWPLMCALECIAW